MRAKRKHALILSLTILVLAVFIAGCAQLPPEPGSPGAIGKATAAVEGYAEPKDFRVAPSPIIFQAGKDELNPIEIYTGSDGSYDYVYNTGYILKGFKWEKFQFGQTPVENSNWIKEKASVRTGPINRKDAIDHGGQISIMVLSYACKKANNAWDCNGNKWMLNPAKAILADCNEITVMCDSDTNTLLSCDRVTLKWVISKQCDAGTTCDATAKDCVAKLPPEPTTPPPVKGE